MIPYLQTTHYTCATSSLLAVLHYFDPNFELSREKEFEIWKKPANLPTRASSIFALANQAKLHGLNPIVVVERIGYDFPDYRFYRYTKEDIDLASFTDQQYLKEAEQNKVVIEQKEITFKTVLAELQRHLLIIRLNTKPIRKEKKNTSNFIVIKGYSHGHFEIVDPRLGALSIPEAFLREAFETLETKKYRDHRMIMFNLNDFPRHSPASDFKSCEYD